MVRFRPVVAEVPLPLPLLLQPTRASASAAHVAAATSTRVDRLPCRFIASLSLSAARPMGGGRGPIQKSIRIVDTYRFDAFVACDSVARRLLRLLVSRSGRSPLSGAESAEAESDPWPAAPVSPWAPVARTGSASPAARCRAVRTTDS